MTVNIDGLPLLPAGCGEEAGHDAVLARPRVHDGVDQVVAGALFHNGRAPTRGINC